MAWNKTGVRVEFLWGEMAPGTFPSPDVLRKQDQVHLSGTSLKPGSRLVFLGKRMSRTLFVSPESPKAFGFEFMDERLDEFVASQKDAQPGPWERWSLIVGFLGAGLGMILGMLLKDKAGVIAATSGLGIELAGFALSLALMVKREWHTFRHAKRSYARDLDKDFEKYQTYVGELRGFPRIDRERRLRYILDRRRVLQHRLGLFSGGIERLGVLPVIVIIYFQFKDWKWGDWGMLAEVNLVQGLLIWALLLGYAMSWHLIRLHARTEAYELLLAEASRQDEERNEEVVSEGKRCQGHFRTKRKKWCQGHFPILPRESIGE